MIKLTLRQLSRRAPKYNAAVASCPGIDPFCSRTEWIIPFHRAFTPTAPLLLWQAGNSFVLLAENTTADRTPLLTPLEALWGFACPLIGEDAPSMLEEQLLGGKTSGVSTRHVLLCGLPENGHIVHRLASRLRSAYAAHLGVPTRRCVALLSEGIDGFLRRRSSAFRRNMRQALRRTAQEGIAFERISLLQAPEIANAYRRILGIEARSWKGMSGTGVDQPPMKTFYRLILNRIAPAGMLRLIFASKDGVDIGYIYGAFVNGYYRGLQFSFDQRYARLSLGNVLQYHMIVWLCQEGGAFYDLGAIMPYKKRWADLEVCTHNLLLQNLRPKAEHYLGRGTPTRS